MLYSRDVHSLFMGNEPTPAQARFYASKMRGFSDKAFNKERLAAVVVMALVMTTRKSIEDPTRVILAIPSSHDPWAVEEMNKLSKGMFDHIRKSDMTPENRITNAKNLGRLFKSFYLCNHILQYTEKPDCWMAFGFTKDEPIPDWMKERLYDGP
jgi:hypothetical protein